MPEPYVVDISNYPLQKIVDEKNARIEDAYVISKLRTNIDLTFANELCVKIHRFHLQCNFQLKWYEKIILMLAKGQLK